MESKPKRICVIGAGASGLVALKSCLEEFMEAICYEKTDDIGGLWNYQRKNIGKDNSTVMESTIVNTSKEMLAYSDFPPPDDWPNWMHNTLVCTYLKMYAQHYDLNKHIRLNSAVEQVKKTPDYDRTGRWQVRLSGAKEWEIFDCVMVCVGHFSKTFLPDIDGMRDFQGHVTHSQSYRDWKPFENKRVLLIGIGNSSLDIAVELARFAKKVSERTCDRNDNKIVSPKRRPFIFLNYDREPCVARIQTVYVSTRRGVWVLGRLGPKSYPSDLNLITRFVDLLFRFVPTNAINSWAESMANARIDHRAYGLKPEHRFFAQHAIISDGLPMCLASGAVIVKGDVKKFTKNSAVFDDSSREQIDCVIFCTGYKIDFPFLDRDVINVEDDNHVNLYKFVFPPRLKHSTLAFVGIATPLGAVGPLSEMQSRWVARIFNKLLTLPDAETMELEIRKIRERNNNVFYKSIRHTLQVPYIPYMDELAAEIGVKPKLANLLLTDPKLFACCYFGPCTPYTYRLNGPHAWRDARKTILETRSRVARAMNNGRTQISTTSSRDARISTRFPLAMFFAFALCTLIFVFFVL